ncbi:MULTISPECIES: hypothetical protein [Methylobacterium]|uniref:Uncharacterized protein n=1 Tax=Methylobacterium jeotgali TaxID=381630 RepID=A0ABQ4SQX3_9HYPH|nr:MULTISPECIES: hypothetical protein [Methylobacterium]PIU07833.1 MAG: hypothetical protein COT56_03520 [Methylobacterium sp. CG09_land_8_20_14_0_10_71_15]PIU13134.1 MAG: hypothetical protein COT28_12515 [Methylobacterium sp. CG08_land_8_20_14_0_20_71_15]GBU15992.1 hypothetical protein AwMethylo_02070 [Methylobacterium sp.]GJE05624.1 hypothetical protein AOPFMNJM_0927 [Methylobacterium jeotgali]
MKVEPVIRLAGLCLALSLAAPALAQEPVPAPQKAAVSAPNAADLLFEQPQMRNAAPGSTLTYAYVRRSGIAKAPFGPNLDDTIKLAIEPGKGADERTIRVQMFSGMNRFPAGPFEDMPGNPIIPLFLENHLRGLAKALEANPRYLKLAIRKGMRERATVTPVKVPYQGREVDGWRITMKPFEGDPLAQRMRGLDNLAYTFVTAPEVPGEIVSIEASSRNAEGGELLEERLSYDPKAG